MESLGMRQVSMVAEMVVGLPVFAEVSVYSLSTSLVKGEPIESGRKDGIYLSNYALLSTN